MLVQSTRPYLQVYSKLWPFPRFFDIKGHNSAVHIEPVPHLGMEGRAGGTRCTVVLFSTVMIKDCILLPTIVVPDDIL